MMTQLRGGLSYVRHEGPLFGLTILAFATTFLGTPLLTLLPVVRAEGVPPGRRRSTAR